MKILLTGAIGYIGKRLLPVLIKHGHEVICCVRDTNRFPTEGVYSHHRVQVYEIDFLEDLKFDNNLKNVAAAYYLIHSMSSNIKNFEALEEKAASNFIKLLEQTEAKQIIYLGGITNQDNLSKHLQSRKKSKRFCLKVIFLKRQLKPG